MRPARAPWWGLVVAAVLAMTGHPAEASTGTTAPVGEPTPTADDRVLVLPLRLGPTVDPALHTELQAALERGLGRGRLAPFRDAQADACGDEACVQRRAATHQARYVLRGTVDERDRNFALALVLHDAGTGRAVAEARRDCEVCGSAELLETIADQGATLAARPAVEAPRLGVLLLRTRPSDAQARVDGAVVGQTPLRHPLPAGPHRIEVSRAGHHPAQREVVVTAGIEERVELELEPRRRPLRIVGAVLLGVGLPVAGLGGALLGIDGRPDRRRCSGDDVDFAGRCRFRFETTTAGIATTAGGVALVAAGIGLLIAQARRDRGR